MDSPVLYAVNADEWRTAAGGPDEDSGLDATALSLRLQAVEQSCNATWWEYDLVDRVLLLGERAAAMLSWAQPSATDTLERLLDCIALSDRDGVRRRFAALAQGFDGTICVFRALAEDGCTKTLQLEETGSRRISPETGHLIVLGTLADVTAFADVSDQLLSERQLLETSESFGHMVSWELDVENGTYFSATGMRSMFGFPAGHTIITNEEFGSRVHPDDRERARAAFLAAMKGDHMLEVEYRFWNEAERHWMTVQTTGKFVRAPNGRVRLAYGFTQDITRQRAAEHALQNDKLMLESAEYLANLGTWSQDVKTQALTISHHLADIIGLPPNARLTHSYDETMAGIHPDDREKLRQARLHSLETGQPFMFEYRQWNYTRREWITLRSQGHMLPDEKGNPKEFHGVSQDVTAQRADQERLRQAALAFENTRNMVLVADAAGHITQANRAFYETSGRLPQEIENTGRGICGTLGLPAELGDAIHAELNASGNWRSEVQCKSKDGKNFPLVLTAIAVRNAAGAIASHVYVGLDISAERDASEQIRQLAFYDTLTGLPNRTLIRERIDAAIRQSLRQHGDTAVLYLDLDHFKNINDSLGHAMGDLLLKEVAGRLLTAVRAVDSVARLSGDEFLLVLPGAGNAAAAVVADKLVELLRAPIELDGRTVVVSPSIGISLFPHDAENFEELLRTADMAMYRAKEGGRNRYRFYTRQMNAAAQRRIRLMHDLRLALPLRQLEIHYQPQLALGSRAIVGVEALLRWHHPKRGLISPLEFIPLAEESGIIEEIGSWVIHQACEHSMAWHRDRGVTLTVSVNCSVRQLHAPDKLLAVVRHALAASGLPAQRLELEITESMVLEEADRIIDVLDELRAIGIKMAIDDFGTGYSNLGYLKRMPIDKLKIDRSFVRDIAEDDDDRAIAATVVALARTLGLTVIAEGVENDSQLDLLASMGCNEAQGFLWSAPMPEGELMDWMERV
jgi:diguanylate cyclase (GGDEF)-like protein/PAS domain S-box-containing protein